MLPDLERVVPPLWRPTLLRVRWAFGTFSLRNAEGVKIMRCDGSLAKRPPGQGLRRSCVPTRTDAGDIRPEAPLQGCTREGLRCTLSSIAPGFNGVRIIASVGKEL